MKFTHVPLKDLRWTLDDIVLVMKHEDRELDYLPADSTKRSCPTSIWTASKKTRMLLKLCGQDAARHEECPLLEVPGLPNARVRRAAIRKLEAMLRENEVEKAHRSATPSPCTASCP